MPITLTMEQIQDLKKSRDLAKETLSDLDKAERAGLDVKLERQKVTDQLSKIEKLLEVYG